MSQFISRLAVGLVVAALIAVAVVAGFVLLGVALYLWLVPMLGAAGAALVTGLATFAFALVLAAIAAVMLRPRRRPSTPTTGGLDSAVASALGKRIGGYARSHAVTTLVVALIAGFAFGVSPRLRRGVLSILGDTDPRSKP